MVNIGNPIAAANAYQAIQRAASQVSGDDDKSGDASSAGSAGGIGGKPSFTNMLEDAARSSISSIRKGEQAAAGGITGTMDPLAITQAVSSARLTLDTVVAVRDAAIDAYNRIQSMPI